MNTLFLCTANKQRSRTAKYVAKANTRLCTEEMLIWADKIYVFEDEHIERIKKYTG
jgi:Predicted protein tyrosine phosphatase